MRLRFAPSPTGFFHVGGARTALYNRILATQHSGTLILRVEDTDAERNRPEWTQGIMDALRWIGADWDEGPYFQSERAGLHRQAAERLYADGAAYYCDCTREQIDARTKGNATPGYDGFCRDRGLGPGPGRALRFRTPREGTTTVVDLIRGTPTFENRLIEDFVIQRGDGSPTFILANVVDDMDMKVSHVIRGEEHLPNTPKALLLWSALDGGEPPVWGHVPVLVNEKRQKLSKRRDKVALESYRDEGYLADAMRNYLMTLGWAPPGDREIVPWDVILDTFRLEDVNSAPAFFDEKKLLAFNDEYVRALPADAFVAACRPWLEPAEGSVAARRVRCGRVHCRRPARPGAVQAPRRRPHVRRLPLPGRGSGRPGLLGAGHEAARRRDPRRHHHGLRRRRVGGARAESAPGDGRGVGRAQAGQGPGPGAGRHDGPHGRAPAVRVAAAARAGAHAGAR